MSVNPISVGCSRSNPAKLSRGFGKRVARTCLVFALAAGSSLAFATAAQAAEYLRIAAKLDRGIPIYHVAGNHDVGNEPTPESLARYREKFGRDYYVFRTAAFVGIVLDSSLIQHPDKAPEEARAQEEWLKGELEKVHREGMTSVAVFQHIPFFLEKADEPDQYFNIPLATRARVLALLEKNGVKNVFAGHYHRNALGEGAGLRMVTTGPVGKPLGPDPSGIRVVTVRGSAMDSRYYGLGNIPNQAEQVSR